MKTVRLAGMTALISSVVMFDNTDAWAGAPDPTTDEEMAVRLQSIADDPELAGDAAEYEKIKAELKDAKLPEVSVVEDDPDPRLETSPAKKRAIRRTLGGTKEIRKSSRH